MKEEDLYDRNFILDVFVLVTKNLNPSFSLERKIFDINNREIVRMLWEECIDQAFYKFVCEKENFMYLNGKMFSIKVRLTHCLELHRKKRKTFWTNEEKRHLAQKNISVCLCQMLPENICADRETRYWPQKWVLNNF